MSDNPDSLVNQGEFHARVPPSKPMTTSGHHVGNEAVPEFHAKTYAPGTAPKDHSFHANPIHSIPGQALNPNMDPSSRTSALDTMPGATSQEIYNESTFSRPMEGQTSRELHGAHAGKNKKEHSGLEGVGATMSKDTVEGRARALGADLPEGVERGMKSRQTGQGGLGAEEMQPESATEVAAEAGRRHAGHHHGR